MADGKVYVFFFVFWWLWIDLLDALAPGVPRNMVRSRIKQIFVQMCDESRFLGFGISLCIGGFRRCANWTTTLHSDAFVGLTKLGEIVMQDIPAWFCWCLIQSPF